MQPEELIKKYNINIEKLKKEQIKLAKQLSIKDSIDFSLADKLASIDISFVKNKILASIIICNKNYEIIDKAYALEKVRFPYLAEFRAYRELPSMISAFNKLSEKPDVVFIYAQGITHPRLGLASHFSLLTGVPSIGVSNSIINCEIKENNIFKNGNLVGKVFISKPVSKPMYISPGNLITINTSLELCKKFINLPHKKPEPMHLAAKYGRSVKKELS